MVFKKLILNRKCFLFGCRVVGVDEVWTENCEAGKGGNAGVARRADKGWAVKRALRSSLNV